MSYCRLKHCLEQRKASLFLSGAVADLLHSQDVVEIVLANDHAASVVAAQLDIADQVIDTQENVLRVSGKAQSAVLAALVNAGIDIISLNPLSRTLEDVYVQTTNAADSAASATSKKGARA
jgi:predicted Fe-Mo cluster-binding NifX family protein